MFQILSLDGGGIRGIFSAAVLAAIESDTGESVVDHFDLIAGTSTGGIIALGLGLGLRPEEILQFYLAEGPNIFANPYGLRSILRLAGNKFSEQPLTDALQRVFGEKRFGDSTKRLIIPSYNIGEDDVYNFRTAHHQRLRRDYKVPAWKVARSTSAAPTYFPASQAIDQVRLVDGGLWANNPTMVAYIEAVGTLGVPSNEIRILNLGTCDDINVRNRSLDRGGMLAWAKSGIEVLMRAQSLAAVNHVRFLIGKDNLLRIDSPVPAGFLKLDGHKRAVDLVGKAAHISRIQMPNIVSKFLDHTAPKFEPIYS